MDQKCIGLFGPIPSRLRVTETPNLIILENPNRCTFCGMLSTNCRFGEVAKCFDEIPIEQIVSEARNMVGL